MLSRRSFVASSASVLVWPIMVTSAQTPEPNPERWPTISGAGVNQQRTGVVNGLGLEHAPGEITLAASDRAFVKTRAHDPGMLLSNDVVLARAVGAGYPLVATDARTGEELWQREHALMMLGADGDTVVYVESLPEDNSNAQLRACSVFTGSDLWQASVGEIKGGIVVNHETLVYSQVSDEEITVRACELTSGDALWSVSAPEFEFGYPAIFASNGEIVIGAVESAIESTIIVAWSVATGEKQWEASSERFLSGPGFLDQNVVIMTENRVLILDPETGDSITNVPFYRNDGGVAELAITAECAVITTFTAITAIDWETGNERWYRSPSQFRESAQLLIAADVVYQLEEASATAYGETVVRGYELASGDLVFESTNVGAGDDPAKAASFLIANDHLYLATDAGILTVKPGTELLTAVQDPIATRHMSNEDLGFDYQWDEAWSAYPGTFLTPNGLLFLNVGNGAMASQSAGRTKDRSDFTTDWHASLGPDDRYIVGIGDFDPPVLDFVPESAEIFGVRYQSTLSEPFNQLLGVRVLIPLANNNALTFEFLQAETLFDDTIDSFATFFEKLEID